MKDRCTISRETSTGGDFGTAPTVTSTTLYEGRCDVQDIAWELRRSVSGDPSLNGSARLFFPRGKFPTGVAIDDAVTATFAGVTEQGRVVDLDRLDQSVIVRWE